MNFSRPVINQSAYVRHLSQPYNKLFYSIIKHSIHSAEPYTWMPTPAQKAKPKNTAEFESILGRFFLFGQFLCNFCYS